MDTFVIPEGKKTGCLPRFSRPGELFPMASEKITIIDRKDWSKYAGQVSLRKFVNDILDQDGVGCHDDKTQVLTETGWQDWSSYDGEAAIGTVNPLSLNLEFQRPSAIHAYEYEGPLHYVDHRSLNFAVTPNHRMFVRGWNERHRKINTHYEMRTIDRVGWYAGLLASPKGYSGVDVSKVVIGDREYSGDDFVSLVSAIVSDGWAGGSESTKNRVSFCCFRNDRIEMVRSLAHRTGFSEQPGRHGVWDQRNNAPLAAWLRSNSYVNDKTGSTNKRIPAFVKCLSQRQIELFLSFYGDQYTERGRRAFYTSSPQIADDLQELILRVGKRSGICHHKPRPANMKDGRPIQGGPSMTISEWTSDNLSIEQKKVGVDFYKGTVYCATVPNSTIVTRRDGRVLVSGNSCATESTTQAVMVSRAFAGLPHVLLNPWSIYWSTSGGSDRGSNIDSNLDYILKYGICPEALHPRSKGWRAKPSDEAMKAALEFRPKEVYDISPVDEMVSALLAPFPVVYGATGHSVLKIEHVDDSHGLDVNSWGKGWGDGGFGTWASYRGVNWGYGAFAIRW